MTRKLALFSILVCAVSLAIGLAGASGTGNSARMSAAKGAAPIPFGTANLFVQINATDGDASLQLVLDGEAWKSLKLHTPGGRKILDVKGKGKLKSFGLIGLTAESNNPGLDEFPLEEFKALFPEGQYVLRGKTVDGQKLVGTATLTHDFPAGPVVLAPGRDAVVSPDNVVVSWNPVTEPPGIVIVGYHVVVARDNPHRVISIDLPPDATSVTVAPGLLDPDTDYKVEVVVVGTSGNETGTEVPFRTS
jgi:hypothetical protein